MNRWKNYFSQLLNVHRVSDVRQIEIHTAEQLVPDLALLRLKLLLQNWKFINCRVVTKFRQNWFKQEVKHCSLRSINPLIIFGIRKNILISGMTLLLYQFTRMAIELTVVIIVGYHYYQLHTKFYPIFFSQYIDEVIGDHQCGFQLLINFFCSRQILEKKWEYNETVHKLI
jgi:hypothetical protein